MTPKVLISNKLCESAIQFLCDRGINVELTPTLDKNPDKLLTHIGAFDGLSSRSATRVTHEVIAKANRLKVIGRAGTGTDNIDTEAASKQGIIVMNTPFGNTITTAEHAIAMMFAIARDIPAASYSTHAGNWEKSKFLGVELTNKILGVS